MTLRKDRSLWSSERQQGQAGNSGRKNSGIPDRASVFPILSIPAFQAPLFILIFMSASRKRKKQLSDARNALDKVRDELGADNPLLFSPHITQPCRSPDTNVLDLGLWNSMKSHVVEQKYMRNSTLSMNQRIINAVMEMWESYDSEIITNVFQTLKAALSEIEACRGGNSFKQPRKKKNDSNV